MFRALLHIPFRYYLIALWTLNVLSILAAFALANAGTFGDETSYWQMAKGIAEGRFSSWYLLEDYYPETLRTPGYPIFISALTTLVDSKFFIKVVQLLLHFASIVLAYKVLTTLSSSNITRAVFLLLTAINIQIPYYSGCISADSINIFLVIAYAYLILAKPHSLRTALLTGVVAGLAFQMRPAILFLPVLVLVVGIYFNKQEWKYYVVQACVFIVLLLPFAAWNKKNHDTFKVTTIEGGAGVAHFGIWSFKLPQGYSEHFYWNNTTGYDFTNPIAVSDGIRQGNVLKYEAEWNAINKTLEQYNSEKDLKNLEYMRANNPGMFVLYNSRYTKERERLLWKATVETIKEDPWFYFKTRLYTVCRFYFTGINEKDLRECNSIACTMKAIYPFAVTFSTIFMGLIASLVCMMRKQFRTNWRLVILLLFSVYMGACHFPFAIQARYTVSVHFCILVLLSYFLGRMVLKYNSKAVNSVK